MLVVVALFDIFQQAPVPADKWNDDIFDASKAAQPCVQFEVFSKMVVGSEDCLYLNVYSPRVSNLCFKFNNIPPNLEILIVKKMIRIQFLHPKFLFHGWYQFGMVIWCK